MTKIVAVVGPTASGKTALSIALAKRYNGEIVSTDSMQIYKGMSIGTAAPTQDELKQANHHLIGIVEPDYNFSVAEYAEIAKKEILEISNRGLLPILCGGTGLYLDSILNVQQFSEATDNQEIREELQDYASTNGVEALHNILKEIDPESAEAIHMNNVRRVIRAIEIYKVTGKTKSEWDKNSKYSEKAYDSKIIYLDFLSRDLLYERINKRVDLMINDGLCEEVKSLIDNGYLNDKSPAYQAIGYKEFIPFFNGEMSLVEVSENIKQATRRYSKRQQTWFKRYTDAIIIHPDDGNGNIRSSQDIVNEAIERIGLL